MAYSVTSGKAQVSGVNGGLMPNTDAEEERIPAACIRCGQSFTFTSADEWEDICQRCTAAEKAVISSERSKGRIRRDYTVWCGLCAKWDHCEGNPTTWAKRHGWRLTRKHGWVCSNHQVAK